jgi:glycosyltransferase involved in cell wall biosynthesis
MLRSEGPTGVHTHVRELRRFLDNRGTVTTLVTPFSWGRMLSGPVFGVRLLLEPCSGAASVAWYRRGHEVFLRRALRKHLAGLGEAVVYAQGPLEAQAALWARQGPHQRVVMAVHFHVSQADEWVVKGYIKPGGVVFRAIRQVERDVIPRLDGIVYVSRSARDVLWSWLPEAAAVRSAVIPNFVEALIAPSELESFGDLVTVGGLERAKNHRFLIEVLAEVRRSGRILTLDLFGHGPCRRDLSRLARSLGLDDQVRFRGFRPDVRNLLPGYRAYVHASICETGPVAILEAMAAGLPILAGQVGGIPELFESGVEGRFWPLDDPVEAARILIDLLDSDSGRKGAGAASAGRHRRSFDAEVLAPQLWSFLLAEAPLHPGAGADFGPALLDDDARDTFGATASIGHRETVEQKTSQASYFDSGID